VIKFIGENNETKEPVLGIGLSAGNWAKLMEGKPILFKPSEVGLPWAGEVFIFAGETEQAMAHQLSRMGAIRGVPVRHFDEHKEQK
jgi:hypothetical protein